MSATARVEIVGDRVVLISPYNRDLPARARQLGGRWDADGKRWSFDLRDESRVRDLARDIYGTDGSVEEAADTVTVRVDCNGYARRQGITVGGRTVASRRYRDEAVRLSEGVVIVSGGFRDSGGSMRYPVIGETTAVIEVRDVPRAAAQAEGFPIVDEQAGRMEQLATERARLVARIAEIDAEIAGVSWNPRRHQNRDRRSPHGCADDPIPDPPPAG
ncbi:MAG: hypothetical protein R2763_01170 [Mycobacterium sp.]